MATATTTSNATYGFPSKVVAQSPAGSPTKAKLNQPYILDLVTRERLYFQNVPLELKYDPTAGWMAVASAGRNNPLFQYTGGDDTLSFTLTWYSDDISKQDVLNKIKWLESLSRNNGYTEKPHQLQCIWGDLFKNAKWIMHSAGPITMSLFDRTAGMMPKMAVQEITLKRVTATNRTRADILDITQ